MRRKEKIARDLRRICYYSKAPGTKSKQRAQALRKELKEKGVIVPARPKDCLIKGVGLADRVPLVNNRIDCILYDVFINKVHHRI